MEGTMRRNMIVMSPLFVFVLFLTVWRMVTTQPYIPVVMWSALVLVISAMIALARKLPKTTR